MSQVTEPGPEFPAQPPSLPTAAAPVVPAAAVDTSQLQVLSVFHYVVAGLTAVFSLFPLIYLLMGVAVIFAAPPPLAPGEAPPPFDPRLLGWVFVLIGGLGCAAGLVLAGYMAYAGRCLAQRRRYLLCMVVAGVACIFMPFGTALGVFTLVVLSRPAVKAAFQTA